MFVCVYQLYLKKKKLFKKSVLGINWWQSRHYIPLAQMEIHGHCTIVQELRLAELSSKDAD